MFLLLNPVMIQVMLEVLAVVVQVDLLVVQEMFLQQLRLKEIQVLQDSLVQIPLVVEVVALVPLGLQVVLIKGEMEEMV